MLTSFFASFSVDDLAVAKQFYSETLGLTIDREFGDNVFSVAAADGGSFTVYHKEHHTPAAFTVLNFPVSDIHSAVRELSGKGVVFERYDGENGPKTDKDGVSGDGATKMAWFADPAGNILGLIEPGE